MRNNWSQASVNNQQTGSSGPPRTGGLLSRYQQHQSQEQFSPAAPPAMQQGGQPQPVQPVDYRLQGAAGPQYAANSSFPPQPLQSFWNGAVNMVRRWSGKMAAVYRQSQSSVAPYDYEQPPQPMVLYHPPLDTQQSKTKPWKRSHALRLAMMRRHRRAHTGSYARRVSLGILITFLLLLIITASSGSAYAYNIYQSQMPRLQNIANQHITQNTRIYDRNNKLLYEWYDPDIGRRIPVTYNDIPQVMKNAMIAAEDKTFWENTGVDPLAILRASSAAGTAGGGSTITQQVIKNLTGDDQRTLDRKINEAALAIGLTQEYPKWKILEMYFNIAPFDANDHGIEAAFEKFFNIKPQCDQNFKCPPGITRLSYNEQTKKDDPILGLARASLLAGMPQNPYMYDPTLGQEFKQRMLNRQQYVLSQMVSLGFATREQATQAADLTAKMTFKVTNQVKRAPHFVDWIRDQMALVLGNGNYNAGLEAFLTGGFNIRTTIDVDLEEYVEKVVTHHLTQPTYQKFKGIWARINGPGYNVNDAAVVVMDAHTGEVLAMNGSSNYLDTKDPRVGGQVNAALSPRQPGSSFKPIEYATVFQMGLYPAVVLPDIKTAFPNGARAGTYADKQHTYIPTDYGNRYNNVMSNIRMATANSFNVPAVKAYALAGAENVIDIARRMGITQFDKEVAQCKSQSLLDCFRQPTALGTAGVPLLQMVNAYQSLADAGKHMPAQSILDIWDNYGHHLYHYDPKKVQTWQAISPQVAYLMTHILMDEPARRFEFPGDHDLSMADWDPACAYSIDACRYQVAAKTGTTDNFKDNWTIGYTPDVVVGVWAGNANGENLGYNVIGITGAAPIWHTVMGCIYGLSDPSYPGVPCTLHPSYKPRQFTRPPGLTYGTVSSLDGLAGTGYTDLFIDGTQPQQRGVISNPDQKGDNNGNKNNGDNNGNGHNNNGGNNGNPGG